MKKSAYSIGFRRPSLALSFAMRGCRVIGVDIDRQLIEDLNRGLPITSSRTVTEASRKSADELARGVFVPP